MGFGAFWPGVGSGDCLRGFHARNEQPKVAEKRRKCQVAFVRVSTILAQMSDRPTLSEEVKTNVTEDTRRALEEIARERGDGVKVTQLVREAIRDYLAKHQPKKKK